VLDNVYEEVSGRLTPEQFEQMYEFATEKDHDALIMDFTGVPKELMFRKNFDEALKLI
jgi:hypothetical protein